MSVTRKNPGESVRENMTQNTRITGWVFCEIDTDGFPSKIRVLERDKCTWQEPLRINPLACLNETDRTTGVSLMCDNQISRGLILSRISGATDTISLKFKTMKMNRSLAKASTGEERLQVYYSKMEESCELEGGRPIFIPPSVAGDGCYLKEPEDMVDTRKNRYQTQNSESQVYHNHKTQTSNKAVSRNGKRDKDSSGDGGGGKKPNRDERKKLPGKSKDRSDSENQYHRDVISLFQVSYLAEKKKAEWGGGGRVGNKTTSCDLMRSERPLENIGNADDKVTSDESEEEIQEGERREEEEQGNDERDEQGNEEEQDNGGSVTPERVGDGEGETLSLSVPSNFVFKTRNPKVVNRYLQNIRKPMYSKDKLVGGKNKGPKVKGKKASTAFEEVPEVAETADGSDQGGSRIETGVEEADGSDQGGSRIETGVEEADGSDQGGSRIETEVEEADGSDQGGSRIEEDIMGRGTLEGEAERKDGETKRRKRNENFRTPAALAKKRKNIIEMAGSNNTTSSDLLKNYVEYFIAEKEEDRRRMDLFMKVVTDSLKEIRGSGEKTEARVKELQFKQPDLNKVQAAEKQAKIPWKCMADMRYALKYHEKDIITFVKGTVWPDHATWEREVIRVLMTEDLRGRQLYAGPSSRCLGTETQIRMGIQVYKQPTQLAALAFRMIRDNAKIINKEESRKKWRRVFESALKKRRYLEIFKLADSSLNHSDELHGEVSSILILNDLAQNEGGVTEAAPDMSSDSEMLAWLKRHKEPVLKAARTKAGVVDGEVSYRRLIEANLRSDMTILGMLRNHEKIMNGESIDVLEEEF